MSASVASGGWYCRKYSRANARPNARSIMAETATLSYAGRNWDARKGKFEIGFEGYKERNPTVK